MGTKLGRTLLGYTIRSGDVRGEGYYLNDQRLKWQPKEAPSRLVTDKDRAEFISDFNKLWLGKHRLVPIYSRKISRQQIESELTQSIADWVRGAPEYYSHRDLANGIEKGYWK